MWPNIQNFIINQHSNAQQRNFVSFPVPKSIENTQNINTLPPIIRNLYQALFNDKKLVVQLANLLPFNPISTTKAFCNKKITKKDIRFRCFDCLLHQGLIICEDCFNKSQHKGHRYIQTQDQGTCDCGNKKIMKAQNFCPNHTGLEVSPQINKQLQFTFQLLIKQLFIWILQLYSDEYSKESLQLLSQLIVYLQNLNKSSAVYNSLTTSVLFSNQNPLIIHLFNITIAQSESRCCQLFCDLLLELLSLEQFREKMLISFLKAYSSISRFQQSKYEKLFYSNLFSDSSLIQRMLTLNPTPLLPFEANYNPKVYFQHLYLAVVSLTPAATRAFLSPILSSGYIKLPFLDDIIKECEEQNNSIINIFRTQHIHQEFLYYKLMMAIISKQTKNNLRAMLKSYYKMTLDYPFSKNKIILVPQRIFIMLIYRYYNFNISLIDPQQISQILQISMDDLFQTITRMAQSFLDCLTQFAANLSRTTYFDNYLFIYLKESQTVLVDYLAIKIIAINIDRMAEGFFANKIMQQYQKQIKMNVAISKDEQIKETARKWNNIIKILIQICLSPRTQTFLKSSMGVQLDPTHSKEMIISILDITRDISANQLEAVKTLFFGKKICKTVLQQCLAFNKINKKFSLRENIKIIHQYSLKVQFFVSLLKSNLNRLVQQQSKQNQFQFTQQQTKMLGLIIKKSIFQQLILKQFRIICQSKNDFIILLSQLIDLCKSLKKLLGEQFLSELFQNIILYTIQKSQIQIIQSKVDQHQHKVIDVDQVKELIFNKQTNQSNQSQKILHQLNRKRQLLKNKKLQKLKQMKSNQQKILANYDQQPQNLQNSQQICLICKERSSTHDLCYIGRLKSSNILFTLLNMSGSNLIFHSCFHTVHFSCFMNLKNVQQVVFCPLCKNACNTIFPMDLKSNRTLFAIVNIQMQMILSLKTGKSQVKQILVEGIKYFGYLILVNMNQKTKISQKQIRLCQMIYALMNHNHYCLGGLFDLQNTSAQLYGHPYQKNQVSFDYKTFIQILFKIVIERIEHQQIQHQKIVQQILKLNRFMSKYQIQFTMQILDKILPASREHSALEYILKYLDVQILDKQQTKRQPNLFFIPPKTIPNLLDMRDEFANECKERKLNHHVCLCIICKKGFCQQCGQTKKHSAGHHQTECLFFDTQVGGLNYLCGQSELCIRSLYTNQSRNAWHPGQNITEYTIDDLLYEQILNSYKAGNLYYFLTHTFEGLKDRDINDRI